MTKVVVKNLEELNAWVKEFSENLSFKDIVLLEGKMGVGKSQLVQYLVEELSDEQSCSPTFAIHNCYETPRGNIDHLDLYRIEDEEDLESTGFWDLFDQDEAIVCIEWADRMDPSIYPKNWKVHRLQLQKLENGSREIQYFS